MWNPPSLPSTLMRDSPTSPEEQQYHPIPRYHFEPIFQALSAVGSGFRFDDVDLVTNRNNLRKLWKWVEGGARHSFRIDLDIIKDTLFMTRWEANDSTLRSGSHTPGYGSNFEKTCSTQKDGLRDSTDHHRVVRYALGPLECVVRSEVDAYYMTSGESRSPECISEEPQFHSVDHLTEDYKPTMVQYRGHEVPATTTLEIKSCQGRPSLERFMPQLWFSRTPSLMVGYHHKGTFTRTEKWDAGSNFSTWESRHQEDLRRLVGLIIELRRIVRATKAPCAVIYQKERKSKHTNSALKIYKRIGKMPVLPDSLIAQYWIRSLPSYSEREMAGL